MKSLANQFETLTSLLAINAAAEEKKNMLRLHVDDSQMEWVCEQHQKGKYL
jgi:hypothetical protein